MRSLRFLALFTYSLVCYSNTPDSLYSWIDPQISPQQNFYEYANGLWKKQHPIPPEYPSWSVFSVLEEENQKRIHQILMDAANNKNAMPGSIEQKIGDFYASGMDEEKINRLGITPLNKEFNQINAIQNQAELQQMITTMHRIGINVIFGFGSMPDFKNSDQMIAALIQSGLSLPDRDYYLSDNKKFIHIRDEFVKHLTNMFLLLNDTPEQALHEAHVVMNIETELAKVSLSQTEMRNPHTIYHMMNREQLNQLAPHFNWTNYFASLNQSHLKQLNVATPGFIQAADKLLNTISLNDWKIYLRWQLLNTFSPFLSEPFIEQNFKMVSVLTGVEKRRPRWKRIVSAENQLLGFAIGEQYVKKYFSATAKKEVLDIMHNIRQVLRSELTTLAWMTPKTRQAAINKLDMMQERIGYPNKWWDYSSLKLNRESYVINIIAVNQFLVQRDLNKIGKPVDREEWSMPPQTINAYYDPSSNNINIPAGILQPPFFDPKASNAINYGGIGYVIGHEITHGFDDEGSKFDGKGNLNDWWTSADLIKFKAATQCIVKQFSNYYVDDLPVKGELVVGEATADLGGLMLAYQAFHLPKVYKKAFEVNGFTPDQQFFLSAAHVWANNTRPEQALNLVISDPHPPAIYRVNGTLANMPQFQSAFKIGEISPMVNKNRCIIW